MDTRIIIESFATITGAQIANLSHSSDDFKLVYRLNLIIVGLSILGCIFNILLTSISKNYRSTLGKMVVQLSVMDIIWNVVSIFEAFPADSSCKILSFFEFFGNIGALFCTCCFAHALYVSVTCADVGVLDRYYWRYTFIGVITGIIGGAASILAGYYTLDEESGICSPDEDNPWAVTVLVAPVATALLYCIVSYCLVIKRLKEISERRNFELLCYPLILIICYFPAIFKVLLHIFHSKYELSLAWVVVINLLYNAQGFLNAFAYGLTQNIRVTLRATCCKQTEDSSQSLTSSAKYQDDVFSSYPREIDLKESLNSYEANKKYNAA